MESLKLLDETFLNECNDILFSLDVNQVREIESISKSIIEIKGNKNIKISYKDGLILKYEMMDDFFKDNINTLKFKSFLARCLMQDGIVIIDFFNSDKTKCKSAGFLFKGFKWFPLKTGFVKKIHENKKDKRMEYIVLERK